MRAAACALLAMATAGCGSIATLNGARVLEPGAREFHVAVTPARWTDPIMGPVPFPRIDLMWRRSLATDVDLGLVLRGGAPGADVRVRLARTSAFDLAVNPGLSGIYLPTGVPGTGLRGVGFVDVAMPVLAQVSTDTRGSLTVGIRPGLRILATDSTGTGWYVTEDTASVDPLFGGGLRYERRGARMAGAVALDLLTRPSRGAPVGWSASVDLVALHYRADAELRRALRRSRRGRERAADIR